MARDGLDAVVLTDDRLTWWLTGFGDVAPIGSAARPRVLVLPTAGEPVFVVHRSTVRCVVEMSAVVDVRGYQSLGGAPVEEIGRLLSERECARVGLELDGQLRPMATPGDVLELSRCVPEAVDCSSTIWSVRGIKSPAEVDRIREACAATGRAYESAFPRLRPGMTERDVSSLLRAALAEAGADGAWTWVVSGRGEYDRVDGVARDRALDPGDLVFVDMGACVGGYWADFSRACVLGRASAEQLRMQGLVAEVTELGTAALVPGRTTGDAARLVDEAMAERRLEFSSGAERYGHGLGMAVTEPPDVWRSDKTTIVPGMVLTMEPGMWTDEGMFHCEHDVVVTESGNEILSQLPLELVELG